MSFFRKNTGVFGILALIATQPAHAAGPTPSEFEKKAAQLCAAATKFVEETRDIGITGLQFNGVSEAFGLYYVQRCDANTGKLRSLNINNGRAPQ